MEIIFPIACLGCGTVTSPNIRETDRWLCASCRPRIAPPFLRCVVCGARAPTGRTCNACRDRTPLMGVIAVGPYHDPALRAAITHLKFHGVRAVAQGLGELLAARIVAAGLVGPRRPPVLDPQAVLAPLPLHPRRERRRGFNQAALLADAVGARLRLPVLQGLQRTRFTSSQTSIRASSVRRQNVAGAFTLKQPIAGNRLPLIILVDDVLTTGATMSEAASALAAAGPKEIWAAVVAHGKAS